MQVVIVILKTNPSCYTVYRCTATKIGFQIAQIFPVLIVFFLCFWKLCKYVHKWNSSVTNPLKIKFSFFSIDRQHTGLFVCLLVLYLRISAHFFGSLSLSSKAYHRHYDANDHYNNNNNNFIASTHGSQ